jgi:hypothetical protein
MDDEIPTEQYQKLAATATIATSLIKTIFDFIHLCTSSNIENLDLKECNSILEDLVKSNESIVQRINKVRS